MNMRMDERALKAAMKKMGIQSQDIECSEVIIKAGSKELIITNPHVSRVNMMGQVTFQVMGDVTEREAVPEIYREDIKTVMEQAGVDEETATRALEMNKGDLAAAIMSLGRK